MKIKPGIGKSEGAAALTVAVLLGVLAVAAPVWAVAADAKAPPAKPATNAPAKPTNAAPVELVVPRAMFVPNGRDPFFPDSVRVQRPTQTALPGTTTVPTPVVRRNPYDLLKIDSLIGGRRPTVSINQVTMLKGEKDVEVVIMAPDERNVPQPKKVKVTCIDIKQRSAVIQVEGEPAPKELFWKE